MDQQNDVVVQVRHGRETRIVTLTVFTPEPEDSIYYTKAQINQMLFTEMDSTAQSQ